MISLLFHLQARVFILIDREFVTAQIRVMRGNNGKVDSKCETYV